MKVTGKVMRWNSYHRDYYMYSQTKEEWLRVWCTAREVDKSSVCTAPDTYPRGWKFDYNFQRYEPSAYILTQKYEQALQET